MGCLLELRHFSGEGTNEVMRSVAVVVVTVHLQREGVPGDYSNISQVVYHRNGFESSNLKRSFQVAGAERLERDSELLPGGT